jgi:hypothetical protein
MKGGVTTSRAAPPSEMLRTVQSNVPPPKLIDPALSTPAPWCYPVLVRHRPKLRGAVRISNQGQPVRVLSSGSSRSRAADGVGALRVASLFELVSLKPNVGQAAYRAAKPRYQVRRFVP